MKEFINRYSITESILEIISILILALFCLFIYNNWSITPEHVPSHFSWNGTPDAWHAKGALPVMFYFAFAIYIIFTILSVFPRIIHFPVQITAENEQKQIAIRFSMICWFKTELTVLICYIGWQSINIALGKSDSLGTMFLPLLLTIILLTSAWFIYLGYRNK